MRHVATVDHLLQTHVKSCVRSWLVPISRPAASPLFPGTDCAKFASLSDPKPKANSSHQVLSWLPENSTGQPRIDVISVLRMYLLSRSRTLSKWLAISHLGYSCSYSVRVELSGLQLRGGPCHFSIKSHFE